MLSSGSRISSVAHQLSCFELGFHCAWLLGACFFASSPFFGARSVIHQLAPCCQHVVMVCWLFFNFALSFDFAGCSLAQEMSFVDHYLPYFRQWPITRLLTALLPFLPLFTESLQGDQLLAPPLLQCAFSNSSLLLCVSFQFLFYFSVFFFFAWGMGVSLPWRPCWFILGVAGRIPCDAWCSPVGLLNVSQAGLEPATGGAGALLVSQCNVALRSFSQVRDSGCWSFDSPYCFISAKCGSSISVRFWSHGAHAVCFWALDAILDLLLFIF
jgi:hypothetical protein